MPEEQLFKTEARRERTEIAEALVAAAEEIESGTVDLEDGSERQRATIPERPLFEVELERLTDSETGEMRYELEYEIRWTEARTE
jgi:amphi-Trp domain-containing protein